MTQNVANAPAWQQSTIYNDFTSGGDNRVLARPGYNPATTTFTNGQPLCLWAVSPSGHGISGLNSSYAASFSNVTYANRGLNVLTTVGGAFAQDELWNIVDRFQMQSVSGGALLQSECGPGTYNGNGVWAHDMILVRGAAMVLWVPPVAMARRIKTI